MLWGRTFSKLIVSFRLSLKIQEILTCGHQGAHFFFRQFAFTKHPDPLAPVLWLVVSRPGWGWWVGGCAGGGEEGWRLPQDRRMSVPPWEWEECVHGNQLLFRFSLPTHSDLNGPKELMPRKMLQWSSRSVWMRVRFPGPHRSQVLAYSASLPTHPSTNWVMQKKCLLDETQSRKIGS